MMFDGLVPKPDEILPSFQDRIPAPNPVNENAWLDRIHTASVRRACWHAKAKFDRRPRCRGFALMLSALMLSSLGHRSRVTRNRRWSSKAIFRQKWRLGIKNSKPFSVCSVANLTTSSWRRPRLVAVGLPAPPSHSTYPF
jgi:hypothetical protein